jgi:alpha-ketoglutarate-dependent taurine dioxygenase
MMRIERLDAPFGCAVRGLDLADGVDAETFREISQALYEHRVLVIKDQSCDKDAFLAFGRMWGTPIQHVIDTARLPDYPDMLAIGNVTPRATDEMRRNGAAFWHTDQSYDADIATATMLYAQKVPEVGGETRIADMKAAYDDLDDDAKQRIDALTAIHLYGATSGRDGELPTPPLTEAQAAKVPPVPHRLVRAHTVTGEKALYGVAGTAIAIDGMEESEAEGLIAELKAHCVQEKYIYAHKYEVGDVAMWDTQMTLHCATPIGAPNGPGTERLLWRISVRGTPSIYQ